MRDQRQIDPSSPGRSKRCIDPGSETSPVSQSIISFATGSPEVPGRRGRGADWSSAVAPEILALCDLMPAQANADSLQICIEAYRSLGSAHEIVGSGNESNSWRWMEEGYQPN